MATTVTSSVVIQRPVDEVFAFVADMRNNLRWQAESGLQRVTVEPDGPVGVGTRITEAWRFMGQESVTTSEITEYEPGRRLTRRTLTAGAPIKEGVMTVEADGDGARYSTSVQIQAGGLLAIAEPLLASALKKGFQESALQLKALLEGQPATR
jgi:uncharacterized protein YndB with AHSA1/START domain